LFFHFVTVLRSRIILQDSWYSLLSRDTFPLLKSVLALLYLRDWQLIFCVLSWHYLFTAGCVGCATGGFTWGAGSWYSVLSRDTISLLQGVLAMLLVDSLEGLVADIPCSLMTRSLNCRVCWLCCWWIAWGIGSWYSALSLDTISLLQGVVAVLLVDSLEGLAGSWHFVHTRDTISLLQGVLAVLLVDSLEGLVADIPCSLVTLSLYCRVWWLCFWWIHFEGLAGSWHFVHFRDTISLLQDVVAVLLVDLLEGLVADIPCSLMTLSLYCRVCWLCCWWIHLRSW
jgi:hypothetical protein